MLGFELPELWQFGPLSRGQRWAAGCFSSAFVGAIWRQRGRATGRPSLCSVFGEKTLSQAHGQSFLHRRGWRELSARAPAPRPMSLGVALAMCPIAPIAFASRPSAANCHHLEQHTQEPHCLEWAPKPSEILEGTEQKNTRQRCAGEREGKTGRRKDRMDDQWKTIRLWFLTSANALASNQKGEK